MAIFRRKPEPVINPLILQGTRIVQPVAVQEPERVRPPRGVRLDPELAALRDSIHRRGQADIPGATRIIDAYLARVLSESGAAGNLAAQRWARDRLRLFMVLGWVNWLGVLERLPDEYPALEAEYKELMADATRFGPEHLVAWWWLIQPSLFKPLVENQLREMNGALRDAIASTIRQRGDFDADLVNWSEFFRS